MRAFLLCGVVACAGSGERSSSPAPTSTRNPAPVGASVPAATGGSSTVAEPSPALVPTGAPVLPRAPSATPSLDEANVRPDINDNFKSTNLNPQRYDRQFTGESREVFRYRDEVLKALELEPGVRIADIGAGTGLFMSHFARAVGPEGAVYAVDIAPKFLKFIEDKAKAEGIKNVKTVLGGDRKTNLATGSVDVIFSSDTYHHFEYPQTMLADLKAALVPGGTMFVLDYDRIPGVSTPFIMDHVRANKQTVINEVTAAGFHLVEEVQIPQLKENYLLRFEKR